MRTWPGGRERERGRERGRRSPNQEEEEQEGKRADFAGGNRVSGPGRGARGPRDRAASRIRIGWPAAARGWRRRRGKAEEEERERWSLPLLCSGGGEGHAHAHQCVCWVRVGDDMGSSSTHSTTASSFISTTEMKNQKAYIVQISTRTHDPIPKTKM